MKPKLGKKIYYIFGDGIFVDKVGYLGKESFIIDSFNNCVIFETLEWDYDEYNIKWFTSLAKAKEQLRKLFGDQKIKIKKMDASWYEAEIIDHNDRKNKRIDDDNNNKLYLTIEDMRTKYK